MTNISHHYHHRATGIFTTQAETQRAIEALRNAGINMDDVSVIVKDNDQLSDRDDGQVRQVHPDQVGNKADEGAATGAATGGALGAITGLFVGLGTLAIPGIGPVLLAGAAATTLVTTLAGTAIGAAAGSLIGALIGLGIPEEQARIYSERISRGEYLVIVDGDERSLQTAARILKDHGIQEWAINSIPSSASANPSEVNAVAETPMVVVVDHRDETSRTK